jgi:restriction system protein
MAINSSGAAFMGTFAEMTGYKTGLALIENRFREIFATGGYEQLWPESPESWVRIRPEEVEEVFAFTLHALGVGPPEQVVSPLTFVYHRLKGDPTRLELLDELAPVFTESLRRAVDTASQDGAAKIDVVPFLEQAAKDFGPDGLKVATMLVQATAAHQLQSPWSALRHVEWKDVRQLDELFTAEKLSGPHGEYFDERFANFLAANFDEIDEIHWRQFEGLAAEFFKRDGFSVELGPGRNDDGVDIRLAPVEVSDGDPAVILVQCKRTRAKIDKLVVKGLWADMRAEGAEGGVIVTTSSFSPGAAATRTARGYPIVAADRVHVRGFVEALKTPAAGIFLGE